MATAPPPPPRSPLFSNPEDGDGDDNDERRNGIGVSVAAAATIRGDAEDVSGRRLELSEARLEAEPVVSAGGDGNGDEDEDDDEDGDDGFSVVEQASLYYDASTMAALSPLSAAAIARLRAYAPPAFPLWDRLPPRRRAAVLVLLYADGGGDLRVVVTMRAASLRNFSGHAALPGGKADNARETPYHIARREAFEEIGLPMDDAAIPRPFRIEHLCVLPPSLARTHLVVVPCVTCLHADQGMSGDGDQGAPPLDEESLIPRLDAREVAALFSAPLHNFLKRSDLPPRPGQVLPPGHWYDGKWVQWKDMAWRLHNFYVPVNDQTVSRPRRRCPQAQVTDALEGQHEVGGRFKVWGMTGRFLVDTARIAYGEEPEMEHNQIYGDHDIIMRAVQEGALSDEPASQNSHKGPAKM